ncbi:MAG: hypothetical protein ACJ76H_12350 [Bacteriovoracaceae bacterium]
MDTETTWNDDVEAADLELIAALEEEIKALKSELCRLSADDELVF